MAVDNSDDLPVAVVGIQLGPVVVVGVDREELGRLGGVAARVEAGGVVIARWAGDQTAHLERVLAEGETADGVEGGPVESQHAGTIALRLRPRLVPPAVGSLGPAMAKAKQPKGTTPGTKLIASNRQARRNYAIDDVIEAGVVLQGSEVKAMREAQVQLSDAYARIRDGEAWLEGVHVAPYAYATGVGSHTTRPAPQTAVAS